MAAPEDSFVVATTHHLLLVRPTGRPEIVHTGDGVYSGLHWHEGQLFVAARRMVADHDSAESRAAQRGCVLIFDESLRLVGSLEPQFPMRDVHGITSADGCLWVTCSFDDLVAVYDFRTGTWDRWYPSIDPAHRDNDINHLNGVALIGERMAVVAHRWGASEIWLFDRRSRDLVEVQPLGHQAHDLFLQDGRLATCSSGEGLLRNTGSWAVRTGAFPRGVGRGDTTTAVGISPRLSRDDRRHATPVLRIFTPGWNVIRDVSLPGAGMVIGVAHTPAANTYRDFPQLPDVAEVPRHADIPPADEWSVVKGIAPSVSGLGWHGHEGDVRWSAARRATLPIVINPGETHMIVRAVSYRPDEVCASFELNGRTLGSMRWRSPGEQERTYPLLDHERGQVELAVSVDSLWSETLVAPGHQAPRRLGVGLVSVRLAAPTGGHPVEPHPPGVLNAVNSAG